MQRRGTRQFGRGESAFTFNQDEVKEEDSLGTNSSMSRSRKNTKRDVSRMTTKKSITPSRSPYRDRSTPNCNRSTLKQAEKLDSFDDVNAGGHVRMKPKLNHAKKNADLRTDNSSDLLESSSSQLT